MNWLNMELQPQLEPEPELEPRLDPQPLLLKEVSQKIKFGRDGFAYEVSGPAFLYMERERVFTNIAEESWQGIKYVSGNLVKPVVDSVGAALKLGAKAVTKKTQELERKIQERGGCVLS